MQNQIVKTHGYGSSLLKAGITAGIVALLSACANYAGIHGEQHLASPASYASAESLPADHGRWPSPDWADQFGDAQLRVLLDEALRSSPSLDQARARVAAAAAYGETARAATMPQVGATYTLTRQRYSGTALVPPPYAESWQSENKGLLSATYDLDLWGKNREGLSAALSQWQASKAEAELVKLTLSSAVARAYNQLFLEYSLRDTAQAEYERRGQIDKLTASRIAIGLDTEVERKTEQAALANARVRLSALDGDIVATRYRLAALLGAGPDRGLAIVRPALQAGDEPRLPDQLPADLLSRRPDLVAARWRVDSLVHEVAQARAAFYPDINLSAAIGLDAFGFGRLLSAASRTVSAGPAIHLPIFDAGALRAQLKGRHADLDAAVAYYNQTLVTALSEVATQVARVRSTDAQLSDAQLAQQAARRAYELALAQYRGGLTNQLTVINADMNALAADEAIAVLRAGGRDEKIALAASLGGGYADTSTSFASLEN